jgi:hypothetical protein
VRVAGIAFVAAMLSLSACSINGMGAASSDVIEANGARVVRTETYGVALRTTAEDAGVTIGYSWTLAVIPDCADGPRPGTHRFGVSMSGLHPIAMVRRTGGIGIETNRRTIGIMLGFSEDAILSEVAADESVLRRLVLSPDEPSQIELRQIREERPCD